SSDRNPATFRRYTPTRLKRMLRVLRSSRDQLLCILHAGSPLAGALVRLVGGVDVQVVPVCRCIVARQEDLEGFDLVSWLAQVPESNATLTLERSPHRVGSDRLRRKEDVVTSGSIAKRDDRRVVSPPWHDVELRPYCLSVLSPENATRKRLLLRDVV